MTSDVVLLGPPAAGKGTQARILADGLRVPHVSTGDMLRQAVEAATPLGLAAGALMRVGGLVNDSIMIGLVRERLAQPDARRGVVLDGFPRTVPQAVALDALVAARGPLVVVEIAVPGDVLVARACRRRICARCGTNAARWLDVCGACGGPLVTRPDDAEPVVRARLDVYERDTRPLVDHYCLRPTYRRVDGTPPEEVVAAAISVAVTAVLESMTLRAGPG